MEKYIINGPSTLHGEVEISGAKNAAVAIIPATVLAQDVCVIENVPNISDVTILFQILKDLGAQVRYLAKNTVEIDTRNITEPVVPYESARHLRASYYFLGAFLGRFGQAHQNGIIVFFNFTTSLNQFVGDCLQMFWNDVFDEDLSAGGSGHGHIGAGFNLVRDNWIGRAVHQIDPVNLDDVGAGSADVRKVTIPDAAFAKNA